jgi:hypothetical protein
MKIWNTEKKFYLNTFTCEVQLCYTSKNRGVGPVDNNYTLQCPNIYFFCKIIYMRPVQNIVVIKCPCSPVCTAVLTIRFNSIANRIHWQECWTNFILSLGIHLDVKQEIEMLNFSIINNDFVIYFHKMCQRIYGTHFS